MSKEIKVFNATDHRFVDFTEAISKMSQHESSSWFTKLRELDAKIHIEGLSDKITFVDDRLILIAFKVMAETNAFHQSAGLLEWHIVKRYLDVYGEQEIPNFDDLKQFVALYIGNKFGGTEMSEEEKKNLTEAAERLNGIPFDFLPVFVLDAFASESGEEPSEDKVREEWSSLKQLAKMMIKDTKGGEKREWQSLLDLSNMMLNNN